ncbi:MAG: hypothetical protein MR817_08170 [Lachnospiraceae bacterium]|nr:hypothetical protein [Lachnospiraceae bacterium]
MNEERITFIDDGFAKQQIEHKLYDTEAEQGQRIEPVIFLKGKICQVKSGNNSKE